MNECKKNPFRAVLLMKCTAVILHAIGRAFIGWNTFSIIEFPLFGSDNGLQEKEG